MTVLVEAPVQIFVAEENGVELVYSQSSYRAPVGTTLGAVHENWMKPVRPTAVSAVGADGT